MSLSLRSSTSPAYLLHCIYIFVVLMRVFKSSAAVKASVSPHMSGRRRGRVSSPSSLFWRRDHLPSPASPSSTLLAFSSSSTSEKLTDDLNSSINLNPPRHLQKQQLQQHARSNRRNLSLYVRGGGGRRDYERPPSPLLNGQRICSFTTEVTTEEEGALPRVLNRYPVTGCAAIGWRPYMEDEALIQSDMVAVFDGHGGSSVSRYVRQNLYGHIQAILPRVIEDRLKDEQADKPQPQDEQATTPLPQSDAAIMENAPKMSTPFDYQTCLGLALDKINKEVQRIVHWSYQGSTAVVVWLHETTTAVQRHREDEVDNDSPSQPDADELEERVVRTLVAANIGDSRLVLSRDGQAVALSRDHKPDDPIEMTYIQSQGGTVTYPSGVPRVNGVMALSRAIGDRSETPCIRADPDLILEQLQPMDDFYVLATDGLWDVMTNQDVVSFLRESACSGAGNNSGEDAPSDNALQEMTKSLVLEALSRGAEDNITVVVVWLR